MLETLSIGLYPAPLFCYALKMIKAKTYKAKVLGENQIRADNQQGRLQVQPGEPSETTRQTPRVTEAYLLGALHDGTYNVRRKTHRFSQSNIGWLRILKQQLALAGYKGWIYKEGKTRGVYVLETSAKFLDISFNPQNLATLDEKIAYIRGFFDAEGGIPRQLSARFYIQLVQKDRSKLEWIHTELKGIGINCGVIHIPSKRIDPDYFRFFIATRSHGEFKNKIGSWHPRKQLIFESRVKI
jgi:hypothetical protein